MKVAHYAFDGVVPVGEGRTDGDRNNWGTTWELAERSCASGRSWRLQEARAAGRAGCRVTGAPRAVPLVAGRSPLRGLVGATTARKRWLNGSLRVRTMAVQACELVADVKTIRRSLGAPSTRFCCVRGGFRALVR